MVDTDNKAVARGFVQAIFNEGKIDEVKNFVTPDIIYHGLEEVKGLENFKQWVAEDRKAFPDMQITIEDAFGEQDKLAMRWNLKGTFAKELHGSQPKQEIPNWKEAMRSLRLKASRFFIFKMAKSRKHGRYLEAWTVLNNLKLACFLMLLL
jgi:predicted ester cyclase